MCFTCYSRYSWQALHDSLSSNKKLSCPCTRTRCVRVFFFFESKTCRVCCMGVFEIENHILVSCPVYGRFGLRAFSMVHPSQSYFVGFIRATSFLSNLLIFYFNSTILKNSYYVPQFPIISLYFIFM
jgi:hypothetical protein